MGATSELPLDAPLTAEEIAAARRRIAGRALVSPLVPSADGHAFLKLECLQPTGSYKIRGAANALLAAVEAGDPPRAIVSASAGNFGQAIVAAAAGLGIPAVIHVPDKAARVKVDNLRAMGADVRVHPFDDWWRIMETRETGDAPAGARFFHPVCERDVIVGAATIGAEIAEQLPQVETVLVPIGGGGLACGIAQGVRLARPNVRIVAVETETATPLAAARAAGGPVTVARVASFIDGMGSTRVLDAMWPLLARLIDEVAIVGVGEVEAAVRRLALAHHVIAEGAGAAAPAAAWKLGGDKTVAIVSGGNIDVGELVRILATGN